MPDDFTVDPPVAINSWSVNFNGHEPRPRVSVSQEEKPVYIGSDGKETTDYVSGMKRARRPVYDAEGRPLYWTDETMTAQSVNPFTENEDGTVSKRDPVTETFTRTVRVETPVVDEVTGDPKMEFAQMNGSLRAIDANRKAHPKAVTLDYSDLTEGERETLQGVFTAAFGRKCTELGIYPNVAAAEAAGAFNN